MFGVSVMSEFIQLVFSFILMSLADSVDKSFANNISLDAVIVVGCVASVKNVFVSFSRLGVYTYRILRCDEGRAVIIDFLLGILSCVLLLSFKGSIINIFSISGEQSILMDKVLVQLAIYIPCYTAGNCAFEVVRLLGRLKEYKIGLVLFYSLLILSDALVFFVWRSLPMLYFTTSVCQLIALIYFWSTCRFKFMMFDRRYLVDSIKYGLPVAFERFLGGVVVIMYNSIASKMDEASYAIHVVCSNAVITGQNVTNAFNAALMLKVGAGLDYNKARNIIYYWFKRMFIVMACIYSAYCIIAVIIQHGSVELMDCFPLYFLYMTEFIGLACYEVYKVLCISQKHVKALAYGVVAGFVVRVVFPLLFVNVCGIFVFAIAASLDWFVRGLYYGWSVRRKVAMM